MSTALFFESVPDSIVDVDPELWKFNPSAPEIPIIISKDYLTLYNFGFAASGNMPMLSEGMIGSVPLTITISGAGNTTTLPGRIVGFSSWLNTVAVPQAFMDWAHERFGEPGVAQPSRLVIEVTDPANPEIDEYLSRHDYEVAAPTTTSGACRSSSPCSPPSLPHRRAHHTAVARHTRIESLSAYTEKP